jgi:molecular chaperone HscB
VKDSTKASSSATPESRTSAAAAKALTSPSSHFELFGLPPVFSLDLEALEKAYRDIQSRVHPDRFAHAGDAERRASLQWTTRVNEAFQTLKNPVSRARHLLELQGVDVAFETNTAMPPEFLMQQMELRERLEEAKDSASLDALRKELSGDRGNLEKEIAQTIDAEKDYKGAADEVRKLQFLHRLDEEIDAAYEELDQEEREKPR